MESQTKAKPAAKQGTRERLVDAATTLMRRSGLSGAGINELVREGGAPKGSIYHFFPGGKNQIVAEALTRYSRRVVAFMDEALSSRSTPAAKIEALFAAYARRIEEGEFLSSCPSGAVCLDLDPELEALRVVVEATFDDYAAAIARHFPCGSPARSKAFAGLVLTAIQGAYIRGRAERSSDAFREAGKWLAILAGTLRKGG